VVSDHNNPENWFESRFFMPKSPLLMGDAAIIYQPIDNRCVLL
jgi:hypothetical protein